MTSPAAPPRHPSRRTLARGAAWSVPTVIMGASVPAYAASGCIPATGSTLTQQLSFGSAQGANGWSAGSTGSYYGGATAPRWASSYSQNGWNGTTNCFSRPSPTNSISLAPEGGTVVGDPDPSRANSTLTYSRTLCLAAGSYTVSFDWVALTYNSVGSTLQLTATRDQGTSTPIGAAVVAPIGNASSNQFGSGSRSATLTVPSANTYTFTYSWTFTTATAYKASNGCNTYANDIAVGPPVVTKTA